MIVFSSNQSSDLMAAARMFIRQGLAVEPTLVEGVGEVSKLIMRDEDLVIPFTTERFIKQLCETQFFEFHSLRQQARRIIGKKQLVPIPLTHQTVFLPLRAASREQIKPRNFLWIGHRHISRIKESAKQIQHSEIVLTNGATFIVPYRSAFIHQQVRDSFLLEYFFQEAHDCERKLSTPQQHRPSNSDQPHLGAWQNRFLQIAETFANDSYKKS